MNRTEDTADDTTEDTAEDTVADTAGDTVADTAEDAVGDTGEGGGPAPARRATKQPISAQLTHQVMRRRCRG
jgi:hypothetical protein